MNTNYRAAYKASFKLSTCFLVEWVNHFEGEPMPTVWAYKAQLKLRGHYE